MIIHYGYEDGSGRYYVSIDAEKCDACRICIENCPQKALKLDMVMLDLDDKHVAVVHEDHRKKIQYTCGTCHKQKAVHCIRACKKGAIATTWEKKNP
jgi:ferredoxin